MHEHESKCPQLTHAQVCILPLLLDPAPFCNATLPRSISRLFKADLMDPGSFDGAVKGCSIVIHTAAPVLVEQVRTVAVAVAPLAGCPNGIAYLLRPWEK